MQVIVLVIALHAAIIDFRFRILPNSSTAFIAILGVSHCFLSQTAPPVLYWILTLSHVVVGLAYPNGFGMGDVKLFAGLGLFLHDSEWFLTWVTLSYGSSLIWGLIRREKSVAFGPHIVLAWFLCYVGDYSNVSFPDRW